MSIEDLVRPNIRKLKPYTSARQEFSGRADVYLDANENAYAQDLNRYPDPLQTKLKERLAELKGVDVDQIFLGNGSDEGIDLVIRTFCRPQQDHIIITPPTFSWFRVCADIADVAVREANLNADFGLDPDAVEEQIDEHSKVLFLCTPNNPTGNLYDAEVIEGLIQKFPGIVVIDEAYQEFADAPSWVDRLGDYSNLIVTQTFSKAWGKAGIRVGAAYSSPIIIHYLNAVKAPYNVNELSQRAALEALANQDQIDEQIETVTAERKKVSLALQEMNHVVKVFPSDANFLLVRMKNSRQAYQHLANAGIIVRDRSKELGCEQCLRITIGTPSENAQLLKTLATLS